MNIRLKRVYEPPAKSDGTRVLVERLWPRGVRKDSGAVDVWMKDVAPSPELRKWVQHDPEKWDEFRRRYRAELDENQNAVAELRALIRKTSVANEMRTPNTTTERMSRFRM